MYVSGICCLARLAELLGTGPSRDPISKNKVNYS